MIVSNSNGSTADPFVKFKIFSLAVCDRIRKPWIAPTDASLDTLVRTLLLPTTETGGQQASTTTTAPTPNTSSNTAGETSEGHADASSSSLVHDNASPKMSIMTSTNTMTGRCAAGLRELIVSVRTLNNTLEWEALSFLLHLGVEEFRLRGAVFPHPLPPQLISSLFSHAASTNHLAVLRLEGCGLPSLVGFGPHPHLRRFFLDSNLWISDLVGLPENCPNLETVSIRNCSYMTSLGDFSGCHLLREFSIEDASIPNLSSIRDCLSLETIKVTSCNAATLLDFGAKPHLITLIARNCISLSSLDGLSACPKLRTLCVSGCGQVSSLNPLWKCVQLEHLNARSTVIASFHGLEQCTLLRTVDVSGSHIVSFEGCGFKPQLLSLTARSATRLVSLRGLEDALGLETLVLSGCTALTSLSGLPVISSTTSSSVMKGPSSLRTVILSRCSQLQSLEGLASHRNLATLDISRTGSLLTTLTGLGSKPFLLRLKAEHSHLESMDGIAECTRLHALFLAHSQRLALLDAVSPAPALRHFDARGCVAVTSLHFLGHSPRLAHVSVVGCLTLRDFSGLSALQKLSHLNVSESGIESMTALGPSPPHPLTKLRLRTIIARNCRSLVSLEGLAACPNLRTLCIFGCRYIDSLTPLSMCPKLEHLAASRTAITCLTGLEECSTRALCRVKVNRCLQLTSVEALVLPSGGIVTQCTLMADGCPLLLLPSTTR